jgi:hypothetical protein
MIGHVCLTNETKVLAWGQSQNIGNPKGAERSVPRGATSQFNP